MFQKFVAAGRLTRDLELRHTTSGTAVTRMTLAIDEGKSKAGEKQTTFVDVVVWKNQAETCVQYLKKGSPVLVEGRLQIRSYDDKEGVRRKVAEIVAARVVFLPNGKKSEGAPLPDDAPPEFTDNEEDVPF